jgi:hypothetical protein
MMKIHKTQLEAKVSARNTVNRLALEKLPAMIEALKPFVGKKIMNQGAVISAKLKSALPATDNTPGFQSWYEATSYSLRLNCKVGELSPGRFGDNMVATYAEQSFTIGEIEDDGCTLKSVVNGQVARADYTVEEVLTARAEFKAAEAAKAAAEAKLYGFGKHDN